MNRRDRPDNLRPPWREGLDDSDTVRTDTAKFGASNVGPLAAVGDLLRQADFEVDLIGTRVRPDARDRDPSPEWRPLVELELHATAVVRSCPRDAPEGVADDHGQWKTKLVLIHVA